MEKKQKPLGAHAHGQQQGLLEQLVLQVIKVVLRLSRRGRGQRLLKPRGTRRAFNAARDALDEVLVLADEKGVEKEDRDRVEEEFRAGRVVVALEEDDVLVACVLVAQVLAVVRQDEGVAGAVGKESGDETRIDVLDGFQFAEGAGERREKKKKARRNINRT